MNVTYSVVIVTYSSSSYYIFKYGAVLDHVAKKKKTVPQQNVTSVTDKHNIHYWKYI